MKCFAPFFRLSEFFFYPLLGHARFRSRCWAAIRLCHRPEPSGRTVCGEVDGLDIGRHVWRFVLLRHRGGHTPFVKAGAETSDTGVEAVKPDPGSSWEGHCKGVCTSIWKSAESCGVVRLLRVPLKIHPLRHMYVVIVREADELLCGGYKWMSRFWLPSAKHSHTLDSPSLTLLPPQDCHTS